MPKAVQSIPSMIILVEKFCELYSAIGATDQCVAHGGGKRCTHERCKKSARGATDKCVAHGGGKRCTHERCKNVAVHFTLTFALVRP